MRSTVLRAAASVVVLLLPACTGGHGTAPHRAALAALVGQSGEALVRRFGPPTDSSTEGDQTFMTWRDLDIRYVQAGAGYRYDHAVLNGTSTTPPAYARFSCRTTFVVVRDRVAAYDLSGNGCT